MMAAFTGMTLISILSTICVFMLLSCKKKLGGRTRSFGDVGYAACGRTGHVLVEFCVVLSQMGFCCAYLIFVGENMYKYVKPYVVKEDNVIWAIVPGISLLCWIPSLDILAPFSLFAVLLIFSGLITVAWNSMPLFGTGPDVQEYIPSTMPIFVGMAIYAFEGIGLAIPIENSMKHPESFPFVWVLGMVIVTITYITFGAFCYSCYGDEVPSIITMVLPDDLVSFLVKLGLCIALLFTYPIAIYPVFEIVEEGWCWRFLRAPPPEVLPGHHAVSLQEGVSENSFLWKRRLTRVVLVMITATAAVVIPDFSIVMAFIGSVPSNIMAFVLPTLFHIFVFWKSMGFWGRLFDVTLFSCGICAVVICTWTSMFGVNKPVGLPR
ncbi:hypothetical protein GUITHDRAFT_86572 [Guillardia theta CCMP2712]|uniref:Amino acid transporter transmembrane domain-containing protein n=1 Tax=Guillardia theta (strain CCMP2712) TaxID=905079 RepID=L1JEJ2_GUITC|nr:hypothetical protein GUITHDRAFT_86572 [Guillardia theta CCMP2712]EKX46948.1 hypothetical protein GUITHDRAFT_86572 [Guillardia theta CCMP2712]|eukprot:XP_005833928.1 hypothetical protein GUITHDRAFT_86572 [Guillardia theta CCMP2712]